MHEMALAQGIVDLIADEARKQSFALVKTVRLEIGALAHVEPEALRFCFDAVARGTLAEGAGLDILSAPGEAWCFDCSAPVAVYERFGACPACGGFRLQVTTGGEMQVKELEVE